jgi:hypothetical protein
MAHCRTCKRDLPRENFRDSPWRPAKREADCRECSNIRRRARLKRAKVRRFFAELGITP